MADSNPFAFDDQAISRAYDDVLVPALFEPWAESLVSGLGDLSGKRILDLATGTGVVARKLAARVGPKGHVVGADVSAAMLTTARQRSLSASTAIEWLQSPADDLKTGDASFDLVTCQQGFQFFPDRRTAAREIFRVLRPGGGTVVVVWRPLSECTLYGALHRALRRAVPEDLADMLRAPFDFMPEQELHTHFASVGFAGITLRTERKPLVFTDGIDHAWKVLRATPLAPRLGALEEAFRTKLQRALEQELAPFQRNGSLQGTMAALLLSARKPPVS